MPYLITKVNRPLISQDTSKLSDKFTLLVIFILWRLEYIATDTSSASVINSAHLSWFSINMFKMLKLGQSFMFYTFILYYIMLLEI